VLDDPRIARGQPRVAEREQAEGVVAVDIDAGVVEHQVRLVERQQIAERIVDHLQVVRVAKARRQRDIPVAFGLARRKVLFAVQRDGHRVGHVRQDACGAVALMHIAIEDQHAADAPALEQRQGDHRQVVEDAEARGMVAMGVMGAAGQVAGQAVLQRLLGGQQRTADRPHRAPGQRRAPRQAEAA